MSTYTEAEQYILDIPKFAGKHTPEDTERLLKQITGGQIESKIIHVAGTNGKGSVCAYLRSILMAAGCSVGMFTSPHLEVMRERIALNEEMISEEEFISVFEAVKNAVAKEEKKSMQKETEGSRHPSFFEFLFLMAMAYFKEKKPEYMILETGLGGRLDATNTIQTAEVCVITEIGFDHMQYLGNTLVQIAAEKAGIIKQAVPTVFVDKRPEVTEVLEKYAEKRKSKTYILRKDSIFDVNMGNKSIDFSLHTGYYNYVGLSLATTAVYQVENASLAVLAAEVLREKDLRITKEAVREGVRAANWPGRMEEVLPGIFVDGAHNEDGVEAFLSAVEKQECNGKRRLMFGVVSDKAYESMISRIAGSGLFAEVAVTVLESDRTASLEQLREIWGQYNQMNCSFHENAQEAFLQLQSDLEEADIIYIAGSLYLIGQIKALVRRMLDD